jgi:hypothetical protein
MAGNLSDAAGFTTPRPVNLQGLAAKSAADS